MNTRTRGPEVASRVGLALGAAVGICFVTGLISHWIQHPPGWFWWPTRPVWLYRVTQGVHVVSGVSAVPLLLAKLWSVYPKLFERPLLGTPLRALERGSIAVLVGSTLFQLVTGVLNIAQYYPWKFFFTTTHSAMAYVAVGALAVHIAVKLPVIRSALSRPVEADHEPSESISRRTVLIGAGLAALVAATSVAGQTIAPLRRLALLAPRSGEGPQGVPVNRTAVAAGVVERAGNPAYTLTVARNARVRTFTLADLRRMPQTTAALPIACVEGWSASADWTGVAVPDLLDTVGYTGGDVRFSSLETTGIYASSILPERHARSALTLVALGVNGEPLTLDHGYPCRLIAPSRPGVLQTKWLSRIEVL